MVFWNIWHIWFNQYFDQYFLSLSKSSVYTLYTLMCAKEGKGNLRGGKKEKIIEIDIQKRIMFTRPLPPLRFLTMVTKKKHITIYTWNFLTFSIFWFRIALWFFCPRKFVYTPHSTFRTTSKTFLLTNLTWNNFWISLMFFFRFFGPMWSYFFHTWSFGY